MCILALVLGVHTRACWHICIDHTKRHYLFIRRIITRVVLCSIISNYSHGGLNSRTLKSRLNSKDRHQVWLNKSTFFFFYYCGFITIGGEKNTMQMELQVALNFLISFLYNKLPRRRVNHFGEELEKALRLKFQVSSLVFDVNENILRTHISLP